MALVHVEGRVLSVRNRASKRTGEVYGASVKVLVAEEDTTDVLFFTRYPGNQPQVGEVIRVLCRVKVSRGADGSGAFLELNAERPDAGLVAGAKG